MAVFSDKIVLKTSVDTEAEIVNEISSSGTSPISFGELVVGISPGYAQLYTLDSNGDVVILGGQTAATTLASLSDVDVTTNPPADLQSLAYDQANGVWVPSTPVVGATELDALTDVDLQVYGVGDEFLLSYNASVNQWRSTDNIGSINLHRDVNAPSPVQGESLIWDGVNNKWINGLPSIIGLAEVEDDPAPVLGGPLDVNNYPIYNTNVAFGGGNVDFVLLEGEIRFYHDDTGTLDRTVLAWYDQNEILTVEPYFKLVPSRPDWQEGLGPEDYGWTLTLPTNSGEADYGLATDGSGTTFWKDYRLAAESNPALGGDLDVGSYAITSSTGVNITSGVGYTLFQHTTAGLPGEIRIESENGNYAGITVPLIPTSYTLELPQDNGQGKTGYALVADGLGGSYWAVGVAADVSSTSINGLADVDTVTSVPVINEALIWDGVNWVPGSVPASLSGNTLGQIGDVILSGQAENDILSWNGTNWINKQPRIQDQSDYALEETTALTFQFTSGSAETSGEWESAGTTAIKVNNLDNTGASFQAYILGFAGSYPPTFSISGENEVGTWTTSALVSVVNAGTTWELSSDTTLTLPAGTLYLTLEDPPVALPLEDGKVLAFSAAQNKFVPVESSSGTLDYNELINKPNIPENINDLGDVDTVSIAPINGQVLEWNGTNWVPGDGQEITAVTSINGESGIVFFGLEDLTDVALSGEPGVDYPYEVNINEVGADYNNEGVWGSINAGADLLVSSTATGGQDVTAFFQSLPSAGSMWIYTSDSGIWNGPGNYDFIEFDYAGTGAVRFQGAPSGGIGTLFTSTSGIDIKIAFVDPTTTATAKQDGDIVIWNAGNFRYEPTTIDSISGGTFGSG